MGFFDGGFSGVASGILGGVGSLIGGSIDRNFARAQSEADRNFQREVYQNQYQWKAADAKKAGLHPLAVLGGGSYSASPSSVSSPSSMASSLGKLGEGIGDAFTAYMNKDEIAAKAAKEEAKADRRDLAQGRLLDAQTEYYSALALEASRRALGHTVPMASGNEVLKGQTDARSPYMEQLNKFAWPMNPDGSRGDPIPSSDYREIYEDVPFLEFLPFIDAGYHKWRAILTGRPIDGYRHNWRNNTWSR